MSKLRLITLSAIAGVALGILFLTFSNFIHLYTKTDGLVLENGNPVGGDFPCFYLAGRAYRLKLYGLYNHEAQYRAQQELFSGVEGPGLLPFVYPPPVAAVFSPLSRLPYYNSALVFLAISVIFAVSSLLVLLRWLPGTMWHKVLAFIVAISFVPLSVFTLAGGQLSIFGIAIASGYFALTKKGNDRGAGLTLALSAYKPPLFLFFVVFQLLRKRFATVFWFSVGAAAFTAVSFFLVGTEGMIEYARALTRYGHGVEVIPGFVHPVQQGRSMRSFLLTVFAERSLHGEALYCALAIFIVLAVLNRRTNVSFDQRFALELSASLLLAPWLMHYDYAVLAVPMAIVFLGALGRSRTERDARGASFVAVAFLLLYISAYFPNVAFNGQAVSVTPIFLLLWVVSLLHFTSGNRHDITTD